MKRVLVTGMSGTGKSAVVADLTARGIKAIDTDYGYCESAPDGEWIWNEERVQHLLSTEDVELLFIAGCASNQDTFYDQLDLVVLLSAPIDLMIERIMRRSENDFGKSPQELSRILSDWEEVEPILRSGADAEIRTDRPLAVIVDELLKLAAHS